MSIVFGIPDIEEYCCVTPDNHKLNGGLKELMIKLYSNGFSCRGSEYANQKISGSGNIFPMLAALKQQVN
jgi:hypothetical protein